MKKTILKSLLAIAALAIITLNANVVSHSKTEPRVEIGRFNMAFADTTASDTSNSTSENTDGKDHITSGTKTSTYVTTTSNTDQIKEDLTKSLKASLSGKFWITQASLDGAISTATGSVTTATTSTSTTVSYSETLWKNDCFEVGSCTGEFNQFPESNSN